MLKALFTILLGLLIFLDADAQTKRDTALYYMKNSGEIVTDKDSADYFRFIMPADLSLGFKAYPVTEVYKNGKTKSFGYSMQRSSMLILQGSVINYYPNGHRKSIMTYDKGSSIDNSVTYYPNGKLWNLKKETHELVKGNMVSTQLLMECRDSTGTVLAENGNGTWLDFDEDFKFRKAEGKVVNGLEDGEWHGTLNDTASFVCTYKSGDVVTGMGYGKSGAKYPFKKKEVQPEFSGGLETFGRFLGTNIRYPEAERDQNITGQVIIQFIIERTGSLSAIKVVQAPTKGFADEAIRVLKISPLWKPGYLYGIPTRVHYAMPINFTLGGDK